MTGSMRRLSLTEVVTLGLAVVLVAVGVVVAATSGNTSVAAGLIALAPIVVIGYQSVQTRRAVDVSQGEAKATLALVREAQRDRQLSVQPLIIEGPSQQRRGDGTIGVQVRNVGRGPAIGLRVFAWNAGEVFWSGGRVTVPAGEAFPRLSEGILGQDAQFLHLTERRGQGGMSAEYCGQSDGLVAYCHDQLGNGLRFSLRRPGPPDLWDRGAAQPPWAPALEDIFDPLAGALETSTVASGGCDAAPGQAYPSQALTSPSEEPG